MKKNKTQKKFSKMTHRTIVIEWKACGKKIEMRKINKKDPLCRRAWRENKSFFSPFSSELSSQFIDLMSLSLQ